MPILDIYKNLTVIGAHFGGWSIWEEATEKLCKYRNFYVDCSSSLYAITPDKAKELIMAYGINRVLFGTDYPMWEPESEIEMFFKIKLSEQERKDILHNNAARLFGIK
jgi:predicted TIM-barrel fold metal-dependent hydrolase